MDQNKDRIVHYSFFASIANTKKNVTLSLMDIKCDYVTFCICSESNEMNDEFGTIKAWRW